MKLSFRFALLNTLTAFIGQGYTWTNAFHFGEIDLVMRDQAGRFVIAEVKTLSRPELLLSRMSSRQKLRLQQIWQMQ